MSGYTIYCRADIIAEAFKLTIWQNLFDLSIFKDVIMQLHPV